MTYDISLQREGLGDPKPLLESRSLCLYDDDSDTTEWEIVRSKGP
jgi:hypothetical protein